MIELRSLIGTARTRPALAWHNTASTGDTLDRESDAIAARLSAIGVGQRHRVAIFLGNTPQFVVCMLAAMKLRASSVLFGTSFTDREIAEAVLRTESAAILAPPAAAALLARVDPTWDVEPIALPDTVGPLALWRTPHTRAAARDGELSVQFTSGVSGRSKIVPRTTANLENELENFASRLGLGTGDATVCPCPLFHTYGIINGFLLPFFSGRLSVLVDGRFMPNDVVEIVRRHEARLLVGVPVMYKALAETFGADASDLASLRVCFTAGAPIPATTVDAFYSRYGLDIHQQYGTTETGVIAVNVADHGKANPCAAGRAVPGRDIAIVAEDGARVPHGETGEVVVRSGGTTDGYLDDEELWAEKCRDGWYFTGDVGAFDESGDLVVTGRRTSFINVAGLKVDPAEVEQVLAACDAVVECAVVPLADASGGEVVKAVVVARRATTVHEIQQFCRQRLAAHKVPRRVLFVDALPRTLTGKILVKHLVNASEPALGTGGTRYGSGTDSRAVD